MFAEQALASGRLVEAVPREAPAVVASHTLVHPQHGGETRKVAAFRDWIVDRCRGPVLMTDEHLDTFDPRRLGLGRRHGGMRHGPLVVVGRSPEH